VAGTALPALLLSLSPHALAALMSAALMIPLLTAAGLAGFWLFYKSIDFFDNI
jgi:hypothetical protein